MGSSIDWQSDVEKIFEHKNIKLYNPRRDSWDPSWIQSQNHKQFNSQVNWELSKLEKCDIIFIYFSPDSKAPISLLELGLFIDSKKIIVCCPTGFYRHGNISIVCSRKGVPLYDNFYNAIGALKTIISMKTQLND
jgi:hypothetical protein